MMIIITTTLTRYTNNVLERFDYRAAVGIVTDSGQETDIVSEPAQSVRYVSANPAADTFHLTRQHSTVQLKHTRAHKIILKIYVVITPTPIEHILV